MRRALLACLALFVVAGAVPVATASPQPSPVCGFCGAPFEQAADVRGFDVTVTESSAVVQVHENGSATWVVRNSLANGTAQFRDDPDSLDVVAASMTTRTRSPIEDPRFGSARVDGDAVVLVYRESDAAARHAGVLVYDGLHDGGYEPWYHVNTDAFTVRGPEGSVVANDPEGADEVADAEATWTGQTGPSLYDAPDLDGSPYVVFGPDRSIVTDVRASAAVALATLPIVQRSIKTFVVPQTVVFGVVLAGVVWGVRGRGRDASPTSLATALLGLGVVGGVFSLTVRSVGFVGLPLATLPVYAAVVGAATLHSPTRSRLSRPRGRALVAGVSVVTVALCGAVFAAIGVVPAGSPLAAGLRAGGAAVPFALLFVLGGALVGPARRRHALGVLTVATFALVPPAVANLADPPGGLGGGFLALLLIVLAVVFPLVGVVPLLLGRSLTLDA